MENKFINTEGEVQISYLFNKLKSSFKYIVSITMVTFILVYSYGAIIAKPTYSNSATLTSNYELNTEDTGMDAISAARNLAETHAKLIHSNDVMFAVIKDLNLDLNPQQLKEKIEVNVLYLTPLIVIEYTDKDAEKGLSVLNSVLETDVVKNIIDTGQVSIISSPTMESQIKHEPSKLKNALILSVLMGVLTTLMIFIKELFNNKIYSYKQVQALTTIPLMGVLTPRDEDYLELHTKTVFSLNKKNLNSVSFVSLSKNDDLSGIIKNLAKKCNELSDKVLIIEASDESTKLDTRLELSKNFTGNHSKKEYADFVYLTETEMSKILRDSETREAFKGLESDYDYIFVNSGSINSDDKSLLLSQLAQVSILVINKNENTKDDLYNGALQLDAIESEILGIVFKEEN